MLAHFIHYLADGWWCHRILFLTEMVNSWTHCPKVTTFSYWRWWYHLVKSTCTTVWSCTTKTYQMAKSSCRHILSQVGSIMEEIRRLCVCILCSVGIHLYIACIHLYASVVHLYGLDEVSCGFWPPVVMFSDPYDPVPLGRRSKVMGVCLWHRRIRYSLSVLSSQIRIRQTILLM
jgi:hypothetical protein